jgi:hypothetical protein
MNWSHVTWIIFYPYLFQIVEIWGSYGGGNRVNLLHEINTGYYQIQFWSSKDVAKNGIDNVEIVDMMLDFDQFELEKVHRHAKINGYDRIKITKHQEITTLLGLEEDK